MLEETGLSVRVLELIELFERISPAEAPNPQGANGRPRFHFVIADFLCERISGEAHAGGDAMDLAFASEDELQKFQLTETATRILRKAFTLERSRQARASPL
jgi:ADP-ribose pyrophosphatase YjhB (NUDIX family)